MDTDAAPAHTTPNGRTYRSKKQRPCDVCRFRRVQCKSLQQRHGSRDAAREAALCEMCAKLGLRCTFVQGPLRKRHRDLLADGDAAQAAQATGAAGPRIAPGDMPLASTSPNGGPAGPAGPRHGSHGMAMDVDPFWFPGDVPFASPPTAAAAAAAAAATMAPDHLAMMNWWATMETPPTVASPNGAEANVLLPDHRVEPAALFPLDPMRPPPSTTGSNSINSINGDNSSPAVSCGSPSTAPGSHRSSRHPGAAATTALSSAPSSTWPSEFSLESRPGHSNQLLGLSGESDPYFLRHYVYNEHDTYLMFRLHFRKVVDDALVPPRPTIPPPGGSLHPPPSGPMPVQFVIADEAIWREDVRAVDGLFSGHSTEETDTALVARLVPHDLALRLLKLYARFVHPRYPVLSLRDLERMSDLARLGAAAAGSPSPDGDGTLAFPVGLRSAVYALAAPFTFLDDQLSVSRGYREGSTDELWAVAHRSFQRASRLSHLSSLQLCLLLLQQPPHSYVAAEPPSFWALSCASLALAENLGLGVDPAGWRLPRREAMLRRRLWWLTHTTHVWQAIVGGRPCHIHKADWDVAPLRPDDFEEGGGEGEGEGDDDAGQQQVPICIAECELGLIAADVLKEFYTLRATRHAPQTLTALLGRAQPLRTRIESWRQTLPLLSRPASDLTAAEFERGAALRLSHLTLELLIFRALLRPLAFRAVPPADSGREPVSAIFDNGYACAKAVAGMVSSLQAKHFANFWPPYVRHQLCYVSTFLLMSLAQSATRDMAARYLALLDRWRQTLRIQARAWPLARLAAMRLDAITWKGVSTVVHGAGPDSPAMALLQQQQQHQGSQGSITREEP